MRSAYRGSSVVLFFFAVFFLLGMNIGAGVAQPGTNQTADELHSNLSDVETNITEPVEENLTGVEETIWAYTYAPFIDTGFETMHAGVNVGASNPDVARPVSRIAAFVFGAAPFVWLIKQLQTARRNARRQ